MKKIFVILFSLSFLVLAASCGNQPEPIESEETTEAAETTLSTTPWEWPPLPFEPEPLVDLLGVDRSQPAEYSLEAHDFEHTNELNVSISISYPQFTDMSNTAQQQRVNRFLREFALEWVGYNGEVGEDGRYPIDTFGQFEVTYRVMLATPDIISVVFEGDTRHTDLVVQGEESHLVYAGGGLFAFGLTFDANTLEIFTLTDFVNLDENLAVKPLDA